MPHSPDYVTPTELLGISAPASHSSDNVELGLSPSGTIKGTSNIVISKPVTTAIYYIDQQDKDVAVTISAHVTPTISSVFSTRIHTAKGFDHVDTDSNRQPHRD